MLWFKIDFHSGIPVYQQINNKFKEAIISGQLKADEAMPSIRELAGKLKINHNTVARAYRELEAKGYIYSRPGVGSFITNQNEKLISQKAQDIIYTELNAVMSTAKNYKLDSETIRRLVEEAISENYGGEEK